MSTIRLKSSTESVADTVLNFSLQVKARFPPRIPEKKEADDKIFYKNKYKPQVLVNNWYEDRMLDDEKSFLIRRPIETSYNKDFGMQCGDNASDSIGKAVKRKGRNLRTVIKSPTEYSVNFHKNAEP